LVLEIDLLDDVVFVFVVGIVGVLMQADLSRKYRREIDQSNVRTQEKTGRRKAYATGSVQGPPLMTIFTQLAVA